MLRLGFSLSLILLLGCASAAGPAEPDSAVTLRALVDKPARGRPSLKLTGTCPFPDGTIVRVRVFRVAEEDRRGSLQANIQLLGSGMEEVLNQSFANDQILLDIPATVKVTVSLEDELQEKAIQKVLRTRSASSRWDFEFAFVDERFLPQLSSGLSEVEALCVELREICRGLETSCVTELSWLRERKMLETAIVALRHRVNDATFRDLYPAAHRDLGLFVTAMAWATRDFFWNADGSFGGAFDRWAGKWVLAPDQEAPFSFARSAAFIDETIGIARREYALWLLKSIRRKGSRDALLVLAARNGPAEARPLEGEDFDHAEARLRGQERPKPEPLPPSPAQFENLGRKKLEEARKLLKEADKLWENADDRESPALYKRLLKEYPEALDTLGVRVRVTHRARDAD